MRSSFLNALGGVRIYPITDRLLSGRSHPEQVSLLSDRGATLVQLREKSLSPLEFYRQAHAALQIARERGLKILINDRVDLALALKADGVHLGQDDLPPEKARRMLGPDAIIGFSTHNLDQAQQATMLPIDYVAIGPIYNTSTKATDDPPVGLNGLRLVRQIVADLPLVAIGGVTLGNAAELLGSGADAVALISDLWQPTSRPLTKLAL